MKNISFTVSSFLTLCIIFSSCKDTNNIVPDYLDGTERGINLTNNLSSQTLSLDLNIDDPIVKVTLRKEGDVAIKEIKALISYTGQSKEDFLTQDHDLFNISFNQSNTYEINKKLSEFLAFYEINQDWLAVGRDKLNIMFHIYYENGITVKNYGPNVSPNFTMDFYWLDFESAYSEDEKTLSLNRIDTLVFKDTLTRRSKKPLKNVELYGAVYKGGIAETDTIKFRTFDFSIGDTSEYIHLPIVEVADSFNIDTNDLSKIYTVKLMYHIIYNNGDTIVEFGKTSPNVEIPFSSKEMK